MRPTNANEIARVGYFVMNLARKYGGQEESPKTQNNLKVSETSTNGKVLPVPVVEKSAASIRGLNKSTDGKAQSLKIDYKTMRILAKFLSVHKEFGNFLRSNIFESEKQPWLWFFKWIAEEDTDPEDWWGMSRVFNHTRSLGTFADLNKMMECIIEQLSKKDSTVKKIFSDLLTVTENLSADAGTNCKDGTFCTTELSYVIKEPVPEKEITNKAYDRNSIDISYIDADMEHSEDIKENPETPETHVIETHGDTILIAAESSGQAIDDSQPVAPLEIKLVKAGEEKATYGLSAVVYWGKDKKEQPLLKTMSMFKLRILDKEAKDEWIRMMLAKPVFVLYERVI
ncbi:hypothetical protein ENBRE01_1354 [Enteropsectra breve]|nr:hypothetical protein ENBRE01_1354 [Enteropsectra breve]